MSTPFTETPAARLVKDILERASWTFAQAFLAALVSTQFIDKLANLQFDRQALISASIAGLAALAALAKGYIASFRRGTISPASTAR